MSELVLDVNGHDVTFATTGEARAAAKRWRRMAAEVDTPGAPPEVREKASELRKRAKAAEDWARRVEDSELRRSRVAASESRNEPAPDEETGAGDKRPGRAGEQTPTGSPARTAARKALQESGVRRTKTAAQGVRRGTRRAVRRYERAGGPSPTGLGNLVVYIVGSIVALVLFEDVLSVRGSSAFAGATKTGTTIAKKIIEPVPVITAGSGAAPPPAPAKAPAKTKSTTKAGPTPARAHATARPAH